MGNDYNRKSMFCVCLFAWVCMQMNRIIQINFLTIGQMFMYGE